MALERLDNIGIIVENLAPHRPATWRIARSCMADSGWT